jgi:ribonuclease BN (tRNA processing enzyme)
MSQRMTILVAIFLTTTTVSTAVAQPTPAAPSARLTWITLGTAGGPIVQTTRSQPANLLVVAGSPWLIDCGDGASQRLASAGFAPAQVNTLYLSHLHIDHTGGLQGLIGIRWMTQAPEVLTIYGPPGTDALVAGIVASLRPAMQIGVGVQGTNWGKSIEDTVRVKILRDSSDMNIDGVRVRAVKNSHFADSEGRDAQNGSQSLSYRFDGRGRSIGYTGDTGPSSGVEELMREADVLVSEVSDPDPLIAFMSRQEPKMPAAAKMLLFKHFRTHHLTPDEAAKLAARAGVKRLVLTHLIALGETANFEARISSQISKTFKGEVVVAKDLDRF